MDNATIATIIGSILGTLITTLGNIVIALMQPKKETPVSGIIVPKDYVLIQPRKSFWKNPKLWLFAAGFALVATLVSVFIVYISGLNISSTPNLMALQTIQFDYSDSPLNHGWLLGDGDVQQVSFENIGDPTVGNALTIHSPADNFYALDYDLNPTTRELGDYLEIVSRFDDNTASIYVYTTLTRNDGSEQNGWLKFKPGKYRAYPSQQNQFPSEWLVYVTPFLLPDSNWVKLEIDLKKCVQDTFGKDGWDFAQLRKIRLRGNISVDSITINQSIQE